MSKETAAPAGAASLSTSALSVVLFGDAPAGLELCERLADAGIRVIRLDPAGADPELTRADLVIEASTTADEARAALLAAIEQLVGGAVPVASLLLSSKLPALSSAMRDPSRLVGLATLADGRAPLLCEVTCADPDSDEASASVRSLLAAAGVASIVVPAGSDGYLSRVTRSYVNEGLALLGEGVGAEVLESAAAAIGMSTSPLALLDALSLDEADRLLHASAHAHDDEHDHDHAHAHEHAHDHGHAHEHDHEHDHDHGHGYGHGHAQEHGHGHGPGNDHGHGDGPRDDHGHAHAHQSAHGQRGDQEAHGHGAGPQDHKTRQSSRAHGMTTEAVYVLEKMAHGFGRMGRRAGRGFYDYEEGEEPELWSGLKVFIRRRADVPDEDLRDRLLYVQALESLRCLAEGVVRSPQDANLASVLGWGFPKGLGGTIAFVEATGLAAFPERARALAVRYGERFAPPDSLAALVRPRAVQGDTK